eukprot:TRINITY_DN6414_c0_g2_i1.p1 TRINITY_DN6414_c0_g2~~TRINITY_DN6414_c0_g2_i1.p1  ORF type:complete len:208 (+),score=25.60 TRINITY_DN6414_c0_g2_i1:259-882(+)
MVWSIYSCSPVRVSKLAEQKLPKDFFCAPRKPQQASISEVSPKGSCSKIRLSKNCLSLLLKKTNNNPANKEKVKSLNTPANPVCETEKFQSEEPNFSEDSLLGLSEFIPIVKPQKVLATPNKNQQDNGSHDFLFLKNNEFNKKAKLILLKQGFCKKYHRNSDVLYTESTKRDSKNIFTLRKRGSRRIIRLTQDIKDVSFGKKDINFY